MDVRLALCTLTPFPIIVWLVYVVKRRLRHGFNQSAVANAQLTSVLADTIPGIRVVKAFAQEQREVERFQRTNQHLLNVNNRLNVVWSFFGPLVTLLTEIGLLGVWVFGVWLIFSTWPRRIHGLRCRHPDRLRAIDEPLLRPHGNHDPHRLQHAARRRQRPPHLRNPGPPAQRSRTS